MALWMETGSEPKTETEIADLEAISALKESTALELKEKGNELVKKGKKHYPEAIHCYSRAIDQKALNDHDTSVLFSNRAHVNLLLGNYRRALSDSQDAIKLFPANVKAYYRAAKACLSLNLLAEAKSYCESGVGKDPSNEELKKLAKQIDLKKLEQEQREAQVSKALVEAKDLVSAIEDRRLKLGNAMYRELTGLRKPVLDKNGILHWPVLLLYAEFMSSDFIEDFCETDMFSAHLDIMFSESCPPLPWDKENHYSRDAIELYYEAGSGICLSKSKILRYLLEGTAAANVESIGEEEKDAADGSPYDSSAGHMLSSLLLGSNFLFISCYMLVAFCCWKKKWVNHCVLGHIFLLEIILKVKSTQWTYWQPLIITMYFCNYWCCFSLVQSECVWYINTLKMESTLFPHSLWLCYRLPHYFYRKVLWFYVSGSYKWVKVNEKRTLHDVLNEPNFIIPMIPVFYVVSKRSGFYKDFITGKWRPPA